MQPLASISNTLPTATSSVMPLESSWCATAIRIAGLAFIALLCWKHKRRQALENAAKKATHAPLPPISTVGSGTIVDAYRKIQHQYGNTSLLALSEIPEPLHNDPFLQQYICAITLAPIRNPILDPNGKTLYDKEAISKWIQTNHNSPVTRAPLKAVQLKEDVETKAVIEERLLFHEQQMRELKKYGLDPKSCP